MVEKNVTTNEIMEFLQEHMVTKEEFGSLEGRVGSLEEGFLDLRQEINQRFNQQKLDFIDALDERLVENNHS